MSLFVLSVTAVLAIWAVCSLAEASIYAVRKPYIRQLEQSNVEAARILTRFKENMEQPISAILIVNTVVAAAGASIAGAQASAIFGETNLWLFSACFTVAALVISEIVPKIIGVAYSRSLARVLAKPLSVMVAVLYPLVWLIERASIYLKPRAPIATAPEDEVQSMAEISAEEGSIMPYEADLVRNVLDLDKVTAREIMTPASVVTKLPSSLTLQEVARNAVEWNFSRIPLYDTNDSSRWTGLVLSRDVLAAIARGRFDQPVQSLAKPLYFVQANAPGHKLLNAFLRRRTHMFAVTEQRRVIGIVTLEDVLESLIGAEIVDELDTVVDMQTLAHSVAQDNAVAPDRRLAKRMRPATG